MSDSLNGYMGKARQLSVSAPQPEIFTKRSHALGAPVPSSRFKVQSYGPLENDFCQTNPTPNRKGQDQQDVQDVGGRFLRNEANPYSCPWCGFVVETENYQTKPTS